MDRFSTETNLSSFLCIFIIYNSIDIKSKYSTQRMKISIHQIHTVNNLN
jgi:hypothetical protein